MDEITHLSWQLTKLFLAGSGALISASLFCYLILRPWIKPDVAEKEDKPYGGE